MFTNQGSSFGHFHETAFDKEKSGLPVTDKPQNIALFQMKSCWLHLAQLFCRKQQKPPAGSPGGGLLLLFSQLPLLQAVLAGCQPLLLLEQASK